MAYVYTADDERLWELNVTTSRSQYTLRDLDHKPLRVIEEDGSSGTAVWSWKEDWVYRGGTLMTAVKPTGRIQFHVDHLGTPRLVTNSTRGTVALHQYYPFGEESTSPTQDTEELKFTGHERDTDFSGARDYLDYMHARYYSPMMGRFLSVDPGGMDPSTPQSDAQYWGHIFDLWSTRNTGVTSSIFGQGRRSSKMWPRFWAGGGREPGRASREVARSGLHGVREWRQEGRKCRLAVATTGWIG